MLTNGLVFAFINNMERLSGHFENEVFVFSHLRPVDHPKDVFHCLSWQWKIPDVQNIVPSA
jgi:hypothetical protein